MIDNSDKKYGFRDNVLWISLLTFMLIALGEIMSLLFTVRIYNPDYSETFNLYFPFWAIWLSFMLAIVLIKKNRYILDKIKYKTVGIPSRTYL